MTTEQKNANEPGSEQRKGGGDSPATQPSSPDKDSHMTESPKESNRPSNPSGGPGGSPKR